MIDERLWRIKIKSHIPFDKFTEFIFLSRKIPRLKQVLKFFPLYFLNRLKQKIF